MKKTVLTGFVVWLLGATALTAGYRIGAKVSFFSSEDQTFRDIYGNAPKFGLEGGLDIGRNWAVWVGLDYLQRTGELTVTKEETRVRIMPLSLGVRYEIPAGPKLRFHVGAGVQEVFFNEETVLGTVKENALGFMAAGGGVYRLANSVGIGIFLAWSTCKMKHEDVEFKAGGLDIGGQVEIRF